MRFKPSKILFALLLFAVWFLLSLEKEFEVSNDISSLAYQDIKLDFKTPNKPPETHHMALTEDKVYQKCFEVWNDNECQALKILIFRESSWRSHAVNPTTGACGLFQAYPCSRMGCQLDDVDCQIKWGIDYIKGRYQTPTNALRFQKNNNWY